MKNLFTEDGLYQKPYDQKDLQHVAQYAMNILKKEGFRHIVYAYIGKDDPNTTHILDWNLVKFRTDAEFDAYLKEVGNDVDMFYAVHGL